MLSKVPRRLIWRRKYWIQGRWCYDKTNSIWKTFDYITNVSCIYQDKYIIFVQAAISDKWMRAWKHWIQGATAKIIWNVKVKLYITYYRYVFSIEMKFLTSIWLRRCWLSVLFEYDVAESPIKITVITIWASLHIIMNNELWGETFSQAYGKLCSWHTHIHTSY